MKNKIWVLVLIFVIWVAISFIPFSGVVFYFLDIFSTYVHEFSHAITTILTGGRVNEFVVRANGSGYIMRCGGMGFIVSQAGYVGTALVGGVLLYIAATSKAIVSRIMLAVIAIIMAIVLLLFLCKSSLFTIVASLVFIGIASAMVKWANDYLCQMFLGFIAIDCCFNSVDAIKNVFHIAASGNEKANDALHMQQMTFIPAPLWAIFWFLLSLAIFGLVLVSIYKYDKAQGTSVDI